LEKPFNFNSNLIHFVSQIPYEWIFPKVYAVIHHGGSGTTHLALKYGCATMIVPHIIDQFVWNKMIAELGTGPEGISIGKLNQTHFEQKIVDLLENESCKVTAQRIAKKILSENHLENELYRTIIQ
jgi:UDP:flavonoid glycosyltransferase YjiC (YdhE family)